MNIFIGLVGRVLEGLDSPSRGEGRWALNLARCLSKYGHKIVMAPDMEPCNYGSSSVPENLIMIQPWDKVRLSRAHFDAAIFTSWLTPRNESKHINSDKYIWGVFGWKNTVMVNGYFKDNDYVVRYCRSDLNDTPSGIDFKDRCFLLSQPFGMSLGESKFDNHRIAWVAKESFMSEVHSIYTESAYRHILAIVDTCKRTGCGLSVFNSNELDERRSPRVKELNILEKLSEIKDIKMYQSMPYSKYQEELCKCSVTVPFCFHASSQEAVFNGLVPMLYRDSGFGGHTLVGTTCEDLTMWKKSKLEIEDMDGLKPKIGADTSRVLSIEEISNILTSLITDKVFFNEYLYRLRPMVIDNIDDHVEHQFNKIMSHKPKGR